MITIDTHPVLHSFAVESELSLLCEGYLTKEKLFLSAFVGKVGQEVLCIFVSDRIFRKELTSLPKRITIGAPHNIT